MRDPWTLISRLAARQAGHATGDVIRIRAELVDLRDLEAHAGETFAGAAYRAALAAAELRRECWRTLARKPAAALMPPVALAVIAAALREVRDA